MDLVTVVVSSALVSGVVGGLVTYLSQRALATRHARLDYEYAATKRLYEAVGPLQFQLVVAGPRPGQPGGLPSGPRPLYPAVFDRVIAAGRAR